MRARTCGLLAAALTTAVAGGVTAAPPAVDIIGGTPTTAGEYPSVVVLTQQGFQWCTGTLVAPDWVLTAAHCLDPAQLGVATQDEVTAAISVHFHTLDISSDPGVAVAARATLIHPAHNLSQLQLHDVGLIRLAAPVTGVVPSRINLHPRYAAVGSLVTLVGYGQTVTGRQGPSGVEYELRDKPTVSCASVGGGDGASLLCFAEATGGACFGDSGGPAFATAGGAQVIAAVTSVSDPLCATWAASNRVDAERGFLLAQAPELAECSADGDCLTGTTCFAGACVPEPFSPGGLGSTCTAVTDCESGTCATRHGEQRCSQPCSPGTGDRCPDGFECTFVSSSSASACWPSAGCCSTGGDGAPAASLLALGVLCGVRRRRRPACDRSHRAHSRAAGIR